MNLLLNFITIIIQTLWESVAVIDHNREWKYKNIDKYSTRYSEYFLSRSHKIHIALCARNSIEWIIAFIAILKSKNKMLLIHPSTKQSDIIRILNENEIDLLITDNKIIQNLGNYEFPCHDISNIIADNLVILNKVTYPNRDNIRDEDNLQVLSFRSLRIISISFQSILSLITRLKDKGLFTNKLKENHYVAHVDFTYNYIIGFLLPFSQGVKIIIPHSHYSDTLYLFPQKLRFNVDYPNTVIITARKFEVLYHKYVDISTDNLVKFFKEVSWIFIVNLIYKHRLKKLFGNIETLVILNSDLDHQIERTLKAVKFPYTITYGLIETGGITSYSPPKEFKMWTMGKVIVDGVDIIRNLLLFVGHSSIEDIISKDSKDNIIFHNRVEDEIISKFGFTAHIDFERKLKSLSLIDDCLLTQNKDSSLRLYVSLDADYIDINKIGLGLSSEKRYKFIHKTIQDQINYLNNHLETDLYITEVIILPYDFEHRDHYDRIRRDMYNQFYIKSGLDICNKFLSE